MSLKEELTEFFNSRYADPDYGHINVGFMYDEFTDRDSWKGEDYRTKEPYDETPEFFAERPDLDFKMVDRYGGEDCGSDYWAVYSFTRGDETAMIQFWGWYQSFEGAEYEDWKFVEPKEKTVTVYE